VLEALDEAPVGNDAGEDVLLAGMHGGD
jgi:hypothetical protein